MPGTGAEEQGHGDNSPVKPSIKETQEAPKTRKCFDAPTGPPQPPRDARDSKLRRAPSSLKEPARFHNSMLKLSAIKESAACARLLPALDVRVFAPRPPSTLRPQWPRLVGLFKAGSTVPVAVRRPTDWRSWPRGAPAADALTVDLYPGLREEDRDELSAAAGLAIGGKPASILRLEPENRNPPLRLMQACELDGVLVQRLVTEGPTMQKWLARRSQRLRCSTK